MFVWFFLSFKGEKPFGYRRFTMLERKGSDYCLYFNPIHNDSTSHAVFFFFFLTKNLSYIIGLQTKVTDFISNMLTATNTCCGSLQLMIFTATTVSNQTLKLFDGCTCLMAFITAPA